MTRVNVVPARYYAILCAVAERAGGVDTGRLLAAAGIQRRDLRVPDGMLSMAQADRLVVAAMREAERPDLGLAVAGALKLTSHSVVSYAILSSPTAGYALHLVARFFGLILPAFSMDYTADSKHVQLTLTPAWPMSHDCLAFHLELVAAAVHWELRELVDGALPSYDIYFSLDQPAHVAQYRQLRQARVHFGWRQRPGVRMQWPSEVAARPLALSDPAALKMAERQCSELIRHARARGNVASWVAMMLREARNGPPSQIELADALNLSTRTLDRYLRKEGASFRELSREARMARARESLADPQLSVTEIALELGYTDASNFARAFRRDNGVSPGEWRMRHT